MTEEENPGTTYHCIIGHRTQPRLLLAAGDKGWALPRFWWEGRSWYAGDGDLIRDYARDEFGLDATSLRHVHQEGAVNIGELEVHQTDWAPPGDWRWTTSAELAALTLECENHRPHLQAWLAERESGRTPPLRPPWERKGWLGEAVAWIDAQVARTGEIGYIKTAWSGSCVLRVPTAAGDLYFKAVYAKPPSEVDLVAALAERWPDNVPALVAADRERRWMIMRDFGSHQLHDEPDERWAGAGRLLAELQIDCAGDLGRWQRLGCPLRGPEQLPALLDQLLDDPPVLVENENGLNEEEQAQVREAVPRWNAQWAELASYNIPLSLHQQDFREGNLAVCGDTYVFYDWGDTVVSHPFLSAQRMLDYIAEPEGVTRWDGAFAHPADTRRRAIRDAYLEVWAAYEPPERLRQAFALSRRLNEYYQAVRWYCELPYLEPGCPWHGLIHPTPPWYLKEMLRADRDAQ